MTGQRYRDGATVRRQRLLDIIEYIEIRQNTQPQVCNLRDVQTFMTLRHGSRRDTIEGYVRELIEARVIFEDRQGQLKVRMTVAQILGLIAPDNTGVLPDKELDKP